MLTEFVFEEKPVRFVGTWEKPEWIAQDVCECLGLSNITRALDGLEDYDCGDFTLSNVKERNQAYITVYESGLYALIFKSRKPEAKRFKRWVFEEVLPSIRKTGQYLPESEIMGMTLSELDNERLRLMFYGEDIKRIVRCVERLGVVKGADLTEIEDENLLFLIDIVKRRDELTYKDAKTFLTKFRSTYEGLCRLDDLVEWGKLEKGLTTLELSEKIKWANYKAIQRRSKKRLQSN